MREQKLANLSFSFYPPKFRRLFNIMGVKPIHITLLIIFNFVIAFLNGIILVLFIPLARGIITHDFASVKDIPVIGKIIMTFPRFKYLISPDQSAFLSFTCIILFIVMLKNFISYINSLFYAYWKGKFKQNIDRFIFNRFMGFGKLFFDRTNKGYILTVLSCSITAIGLLDLFNQSTLAVFSLLVNIPIMFIVSWILTIITFLVVPFLYYALKAIIKQPEKLSAQKNAVQNELSQKIINIFSCIPLVKAYSKEKQTEEIHSSINEQLRKINFSTDKISNLIPPLQEVIIMTFLLFIAAIIVLFFTRNNTVTIPALILFFYVARCTLPRFAIFNRIKNSLGQMKPKLELLMKSLDGERKFFVVEGGKVFSGLLNSIDFCHLSFSYTKRVPVLKNINFSIERGKTTAIVGPTGSGKTTLINLLMRFYDCPPSSIKIDGVDIRDFTLESLRSHMALVSQETWLFNDTLRNNIIFGLDKEVRDDELIGILKKAQLYDFIARLPKGLDTKIGEGGAKLSGGEKQRVAIARSLLKNSEILILDEATSSLDSNTERLIQEAIEEAIKEKTAIVIAHKLSTIKNADKIVVIKNGCFIKEGCLNELIKKKASSTNTG